MPQFFVRPERVKDKTFSLDGPEAYHVAKVLRRREGEEIELFDGRGGRYRGKIVSILPDGTVEGKIAETLSARSAGPTVRLDLYPALLKSSRWEWLLEKGTELGVSAFHPVTTQRTVVLLHEAERIRAKGDRWSKIVMSAAKQCGRAELPAVGEPKPLRDALAEAQKKGLVLFGWEGMSGSPAGAVLKQALTTDGKRALTVSLFVGPEGGFTAEEVELAQSHDAILFGLGASTLRGETATIAAVSVLLYELGVL